MDIKFYDKNFYIDNVKYVIIASEYNNKWIFVREKGSSTYSMPAGHIEEGELYEEAAKRELYEETGAVEYDLKKIGIYSVEEKDEKTFGILFYANIFKLDRLPDFEIEEIKFFENMPEDKILTYPEIQKHFYKKILEEIKNK